MQQKVTQSPPPTINIVDKKPPPTSWVNDNIVQYLQDQSQAAFLTDVVTYAQVLQGQQMAQTRPRATQMQESFQTIPDKGSAEDIAKTATFNDTQGLVKTEIESLAKMIDVLMQSSPQQGDQLKGMLSQLQQLAQNFPRLSPQQMQSLNTIMQQIQTLAQNTPQGTQQALSNIQLQMLQSMMGANNGNIQDYQSEINELQAQNQKLEQFAQQAQNVKNTLLNPQPPTAANLNKLIENLQEMVNSLNQLNPQQQQQASSFFNQLQSFKNTSGQSLSQLLAAVIISNKTSAFLQSNPQATSTQVASFLKQFLQQSNLQKSSVPFMQSMGQSIDDMINQKGFPLSEGIAGQPFAQGSDGQISVNEQVMSAILGAFSPDPSSAQGLQKAAGSLAQSLTDETNANQAKISGFQTASNDLSKLQDNLGQASASTFSQAYVAGTRIPPTASAAAAAVPSPKAGLGAAPPPPAAPAAAAGGGQPNLQYEFEQAILNHYMPGQQAYLEALAMVMYICNMGAGFGNTLMSALSSYANAATNYDFSNSLHQYASGSNDYSGSVSKAKQQLSNEKTQVANDIKNTQNAIKDINSELKEIKSQMANAKTSSQKAALSKMYNSLVTIQQNLTSCLSQLTALQTVLSTMTVSNPTSPPTPPPTPSKAFSISSTDPSWSSHLSSAEYNVINGNSSYNPAGGLTATNQSVIGFQQNYSNQSQNQQMILQMRMTEIQQEWTVVSTALQLLNQMFMSLAQGILGT